MNEMVFMDRQRTSCMITRQEKREKTSCEHISVSIAGLFDC